MDGKELYAMYEASGPQLLPSWEMLTNEDRWRFTNTATRLYDAMYDQIASAVKQEIREML